MPPKIPANNRADDNADNIQKKQCFLQLYLNSLVQSPDFRHSDYLQSFLSEQNEKTWEQVKKSGKRVLKKCEKLSDFTSPDGQIFQKTVIERLIFQVSMSRYMIKFIYSISLFRLREKLELLTNLLHESARIMSDISGEYTRLMQLELKYSEIATEHELLNKMSQSFKSLSQNTHSQADNISHQLINLSSFQNDFTESYNEMLRKRDEVLREYSIQQQKLEKRKEKLWIAKDVSKWEIIGKFDRNQVLSDQKLAYSVMLTKDTNACEMIRKKLGLFNTQF